MTKFWHGKRVLVTGGAGFIGSHVVDLLVANHAQVTATSTRSDWPASLAHHGRDAVRVVKADLTNADECVAVFRGQNVVLNIAHADGSAEFKRRHPASIFQRNLSITMNALAAACRCEVDRILIMSSAEVYPKTADGLLRESDATSWLSDCPEDGYAWSKRMSECAARLFAAEHGLAVAIARPNNVYGPRDYFDTVRSRVVPTMFRQAHEDGVLRIWGDGSQRRTFLYVEDLARGLLDLVERHAVCEPVNFAGDDEITIGELAEMIGEVSGRPCHVALDPSKAAGPSRRALDTTFARRTLGFTPSVPLRVGLQRTLSAYLEQEISQRI